MQQGATIVIHRTQCLRVRDSRCHEEGQLANAQQVLHTLAIVQAIWVLASTCAPLLADPHDTAAEATLGEMHHTPRGEAAGIPPGASTHRPTGGRRERGAAFRGHTGRVPAASLHIAPARPRRFSSSVLARETGVPEPTSLSTVPQFLARERSASPPHHHHVTTDCRLLHGAHHTLRTHIHTDPNTHLTLARA